ncbi:hypothetical protein HYX04_01505 [Candidatus Woesearchaeota archaeon]|nr:hypothetical protein [Candidatus Woesearchaeota archaeon]
MKKYFIYCLILVFSIGLVHADAEDFAEAKKIIDAKTPCSKLTESQLEIIGDYLMEQAHPGQTHELMDKMMGGEGSESLRLMHIAMAKRLYCNDIDISVNYGMMGYGMMGGLGGTTNYGGMMNMMGNGLFGTNMMGYGSGYGMMGNYSYGYWGFLNFLSLVLVIGLIILVYLWIMKLWKEVFKKTK